MDRSAESYKKILIYKILAFYLSLYCNLFEIAIQPNPPKYYCIICQ
nr:MAG TPA: hypothetical protein [Caudoviricetes sp.]